MKNITSIIGVFALAILSGCASREHLPRGARMVGSGFQISWNAPTNGTAILVEQKTGKTIATKSVTSNGPAFRFDRFSPEDANLLVGVFADKLPSNARFILYFVPAE